ncbi:MAG TPA: hypothetical protein EYP80_02240 [Candidatus Aenigmarchaeota archaeon]|nr:hypothetical protein [Candidatus Aenigmarchaeota archaeon]
MVEINAFLVGFANNVVTFIPNLVGALIILIVGYIVGKVIGIVIEKICVAVKLNKYVKLKGFKLEHLLRIAGEWIIYLVFIQSAAQYLRVLALASFVNEIVYFIPKAVGAAIIVVVGYILGSFFEDQIKKSEGIYKNIVGKVVNFFTVYMAIALALPFLGIDPSLVNNILLIIVGSFGLGFAIALGLGLKDIIAREADKYIGEFEKVVAKKRKR